MQELDEGPPPSPQSDYGELEVWKELEALPSLPDIDLDTIDFNDSIFDLVLEVESQADAGEVAMPTGPPHPEVGLLDKRQTRSRKRTRRYRSEGCPETTGHSPPKRRTQRGPGAGVKKTAETRKSSVKSAETRKTSVKSAETRKTDVKKTAKTRKTSVKKTAETRKTRIKTAETRKTSVKKTAETRKRRGSSPTTGAAGSAPTPAEVVTLCPSPPRVLQFSPSLRPSVQLVSLSDGPGYQLVTAVMEHSPRLLSLILPSNAATPTYILVPSPSQHTRPQVNPLSPDAGAVAPDLMGSSPSGSLSDCASNVLRAPSPSKEVSPCKRSTSSPVTAMPECVKDYLEQTRAHMRESCQEMEAGLRLDSHYVDVQLVPRQILSHANRSLDRELVVMGDVERELSLLQRNQIFQSTEGTKPKRSIVLMGNTGMGKSTLIKKLCLDWSDGAFPQFDFLFLLDGKALTLTDHTYSLQSLLLRLSTCAPRCHAPEAVFTRVLSAPQRVLLVLDGFDKAREYEVLLLSKAEDFGGKSRAPSYSVRQLYAALLQRRLLAGCTLLLCAREREVGSQLLRRADSLLELCGFSPADVQAYLGRYFAEAGRRASALERLRSHRYLLSLCWNPALCRAVCSVLERSPGSVALPSTLTGLWRRVLRLRLRAGEGGGGGGAGGADTGGCGEVTSASSGGGGGGDAPPTCGGKKRRNGNALGRTRSRTQTQAFREGEEEEKKEVEEEMRKVEDERKEREEEVELLSRLSSLAWEGLKGQPSPDRTISARLRGLGLRCGLLHSHSPTGRRGELADEREREKKEESQGDGGEEDEGQTSREGRDADDVADDAVLSWAHPFLQSFLGGANLALSRAVSERSFLLQTLPSQPRGRRRTQGEGLGLAHRCAIGLLFQSEEEGLRDLVDVDAAVMDAVVSKRGSVTTHLEKVRYGELDSARLLEVCHYVHETGEARLARHLVKNLPEVLSFHKVPLCPPDAFVVWSLLEKNRSQRRGFCLGLEDTGVRIDELRALVGLSNVASYRACVADTIALWQDLQEAGEEELLKDAVTKLVINPFRATQVCHIEHLSRLVHIHTQRTLPGSQSESVLGEGIPAIRDLDKLEYELGPVNGPLALPTFLEFLPSLNNLRHLDLSQSGIGDRGVEKLAAALCTLPSLHRLSLCSNEIADAGAETLAAFLPKMTSLAALDVKYNKFTDVGAQRLANSLRACSWIKSLGIWNEFIPNRELERLQQQDCRIHSH